MDILFAFIGGFALCYVSFVLLPSIGKGAVKEPEQSTILVKRSKPSLRNPMRTNTVAYEKYKTSDTGLFQPVKPKQPGKDEIEVGR